MAPRVAFNVFCMIFDAPGSSPIYQPWAIFIHRYCISYVLGDFCNCSNCAPDCSQMLSASSQMPDAARFPQMLPDAPRCFQMSKKMPDAIKCSCKLPGFPNASERLQRYPDVKCFLNFPGCLRCCPMPTGIRRNFQKMCRASQRKHL